MPLTFSIDADDEGLRLDKFLRRELPSVPLSHLHKLLRTRKVKLNGARGRAADRLSAGDEVVVRGDPERLRGSAEGAGRGAPTRRRDFEVLHTDEHLLAVAKPAGLAIHPGTGIDGATLVEQVRAHLEEDAPVDPDATGFRPSPGHRLDRQTSGVVLVARTRKAMVGLTEAFTARQVHKVYLAVVKGRMPEEMGEIDLALAEHQQTARSKAERGTNYQPAVTRYTQLERGRQVSLLEVHPGTGRTHQIRRHLASVGHPIVGDRRYGDFPFNRDAKIELGVMRQLLHAWRLELAHPVTGEALKLVAPPPPDMRESMEKAGLKWTPETPTSRGRTRR